jgi:hypothetical protein
MHQRFRRRGRDHRHRDVRHQNHQRLGHLRLQHQLRHRRNLGEHRHRNLGEHRLGHLHQLGVGYPGDPERRLEHPDDLERQCAEHPGDPFLGLVRTGCCPVESSGVEYPCPGSQQTGCCPVEEYR